MNHAENRTTQRRRLAHCLLLVAIYGTSAGVALGVLSLIVARLAA